MTPEQEFNEEELDNVFGGTKPYEEALQDEIDRLNKELQSPNNNPYETEDIKRRLEKLQEEQAELYKSKPRSR